jgi:hypothetical protein
MEHLKFPVGIFIPPTQFSKESNDNFIEVLETFPQRIKEEVINCSDKELLQTYRPDGWNIRQLVHHCADSHSNAFIRLKFALTEQQPTIKPYNQDLWALLPDSNVLSIMPSLQMLEGIHARWSYLLKSLNNDEYNKSYIHPEYNKVVTIFEFVALYAWHCNHHLAHIKLAKKNLL